MARKVIDAIEDALCDNRRFFALEFFPPKTTEGESNLYPRMDKLGRQLQPLWCGLTHGDTLDHAFNIALTAQSVLSIDMQVNVTASSFTREGDLQAFLDRAKAAGFRNLLLMRGVTRPLSDGDFQTAADLVRFVRRHSGDYFCLGVVGHPEGYDCDLGTYDKAIADLKEKVDAGADLVISAMVFSAPLFLRFCADCQAAGIRCPIIPGIMPVQSRAQFRHWFDRTGCEDLKRRVEAANRHDDAEVKRIGIDFISTLLRQLFRGGVRGAYFFTMNLESVVSAVVETAGLAGPGHKELPWRQSADLNRSQREMQRPIYWSGRPTSYMARTACASDDFPNGRYGDSMSPAFGENTTYHTALALSATARNCHWMFVAKTLHDVCTGFTAFLEGRGRLPWCDENLAPEADVLLESTLKPLNRRAVLTINSQPAANGMRSEDPQVGWGPPGGYVYQRQYLEFFCSRETLRRVVDTFGAYESLAFIALDAKGDVVESSSRPAGARANLGMRRSSSLDLGKLQQRYASLSAGSPAAPSPTKGDNAPASPAATFEDETTTVTWGVFPNRPIIQPTIVSLAAFRAWAPEAFSLWRLPFVGTAGTGSSTPTSTSANQSILSPAVQPASPPASADGPHVRFSAVALLQADDFPSAMPPVLRTIASEWVLVSVLDNDFVSSPTSLDRAVAQLCAALPVVDH
jgi:methylenetetrahydrofolate reductase (NADPH)